MDSVLSFKTSRDDFDVEFDILAPTASSRLSKIECEIQEIDDQLMLCQQSVDEINTDIDRLTNHSDGLDYTIAALSGILTGLIDSFVVGEWNMAEAKAWSSQKINQRITEFANKDPEYAEFLKKRKNRENSSLNAIEFLERKYMLPGDNAWNVKVTLVNQAKNLGFDGKGYEDALKFLNERFPKEGGWAVADTFITAKTHHLDDLCHHPTIIGLIACVVVQFTGHSIYSNKNSELIRLPVTVNEYGKFVGTADIAKLFSGVINWFLNCAYTLANRKGHLLSDMAGSFSSATKRNEGMGLPGSFLSTMKELSMLPIFTDTNFAENLRKAYTNGIGDGNAQLDLGAFNALFDGAKFDVRTEMAIGHEIKRQVLPAIFNEVLVRGAYFIRHFIAEIRIHNGFQGVEWKKIIPFNNRTIARMITIASGTFTAVDLGDAAIRSCGFNAACVLRINFVGVGRFAIALTADAGMGAIEAKRLDERMHINTLMLSLSEAKVFYKQEAVWCEAENTRVCLSLLSQLAQNSLQISANLHTQIEETLDDVAPCLRKLADADSSLASSLLDQLLFE